MKVRYVFIFLIIVTFAISYFFSNDKKYQERLTEENSKNDVRQKENDNSLRSRAIEIERNSKNTPEALSYMECADKIRREGYSLELAEEIAKSSFVEGLRLTAFRVLSKQIKSPEEAAEFIKFILDQYGEGVIARGVMSTLLGNDHLSTEQCISLLSGEFIPASMIGSSRKVLMTKIAERSGPLTAEDLSFISGLPLKERGTLIFSAVLSDLRHAPPEERDYRLTIENTISLLSNQSGSPADWVSAENILAAVIKNESRGFYDAWRDGKLEGLLTPKLFNMLAEGAREGGSYERLGEVLSVRGTDVTDPKIYQAWASTNRGEMSAWFKNQKDLPQIVTDRVNAAMVSTSEIYSSQDVISARENLQKIRDPQVREEAMEKVDAYEVEFRKKQLETNQVEALGDLLNVNAPMQPEVSGELMNTFIEKDWPAASAWISKNWDEIPLVRKDHIAASITSYSLKQGDLENARSWLSEISDGSIRQQVETEVAVAELRAKRSSE